MEIQEAIKEAKGQVVGRHGYQLTHFRCIKGKYVCVFDNIKGQPFVITDEDFQYKDWEVIPVKKEMVSADEWIDSRETTDGPLKDCDKRLRNMLVNTFEASAENRDILYADLMNLTNEYCKEYHRSEIVAKIRPVIDKINAVLATSSTG